MLRNEMKIKVFIIVWIPLIKLLIIVYFFFRTTEYNDEEDSTSQIDGSKKFKFIFFFYPSIFPLFKPFVTVRFTY